MRYNDVLLYKIIRPIVTLFMKVVYRPRIIGVENIKENGRLILAGNHTNNFDSILLISSTKRNIHFLAKVELFRGIKKILFNNLGLIPVDRKKKKHDDVYEKAYGYLHNEKVIGIFPEGTIGRNGILPFKPGVIKMGMETDCEIVPFAITGKYKIFSNNLKIEFGKPIKVKGNDIEKETEMLRNIIINMIGGKK